LAAVGVGVGLGLDAMKKNDDSKSASECLGDLCTAQGRRDRNDAIAAGNWATVGIVGGAVLAAGSVTLLIVGKHKETPTAASIDATPVVGAQFVGGVIRGRF
jgi:hypothetical protein